MSLERNMVIIYTRKERRSMRKWIILLFAIGAGCITILLMNLIELLFLQYNFSIHDFRPGLVFPAGGFIDGFFCVFGMFIIIKINKVHLRPEHFVIAGVLGLLGFFCINYMGYFTAYIDCRGVINHAFRGLHISNFEIKQKPMTFMNYLNYLFNNYTVTTYSIGGGLTLDKTNLGISFHKFTFVLEGIGFVIGGIVSGVIGVQAKEYCKSCKLPFEVKSLYAIELQNLEQECKNIMEAITSKSIFQEFIQTRKIIEHKTAPYFSVNLKYCISCKTAFLEYRYMKPRTKADGVVWKEDKDKCIIVEVPYRIV